jgi:hypothetical protein
VKLLKDLRRKNSMASPWLALVKAQMAAVKKDKSVKGNPMMEAIKRAKAIWAKTKKAEAKKK